MSNLLAGFGSSANALDTLQRALSVVQNNVSNASTPGYATQRLNLEALPFDVVGGVSGGVAGNSLVSSRSSYADFAVQLQLQSLGYYTAQSQSASAVESYFDPSGTTGVAQALNKLFTSFSALATTPSDTTARQQVISSASALAAAVNGLDTSLTNTSAQLNRQIASTVDQVNALAAHSAQYNAARQREGISDPGLDAQLHTDLENLSQLIDFTSVQQADGTVTIVAGSGTPLVNGDQASKLSSTQTASDNPPPVNAQGIPGTRIVDANGTEITDRIKGGQLGGLLDARNRALASIIGDAQQPGSLNQFASALADTVNGILESGTVSNAPGAQKGVALFSYNTSDPTLAAGTLAITGITADQLAAADSAGNANGNANQLASLASSTAGVEALGNQSLTEFFSGIVSRAGQESQTAQQNTQAQTQVVSQVRTTRDQLSGFSLDAQAADVLQLQRGYQAVSRVLTVLNSLVDSVLGLIPQ